MGTQGIVGVATETGGFRGRYVHWDGDTLGARLAEIVERDGIETAIRTLTVEHFGWSTVNGQAEQELDASRSGGRFAAVPGYGVAYTTAEGQGDPEEWYTERDTGAAAYAYGIIAGQVRVWEDDGDRWVRREDLDIPLG